MPRFPYMNFPFPFYQKPFKNPTVFHSVHEPCLIDNSTNIKSLNTEKKDTDLVKAHKKNKSNKNTSNYLFDLFGLKIYSDDVLLISLIYFLYSEDVKDDGLFLVLLLLLLN